MNVTVTLTEDTAGVDWAEFCTLFRVVGFGERGPDLARRLFAASYVYCFAWDQDILIGSARALSDGIFSSTIYDVMVHPEYQGQGVGRALMNNLLGRLPKRSVMLISTHGHEGFYQNLGFKRLRTAYILQEDFGPWRTMGYLDDDDLSSSPASRANAVRLDGIEESLRQLRQELEEQKRWFAKSRGEVIDE